MIRKKFPERNDHFSTVILPDGTAMYDDFVCELAKEMGSDTLNTLHAAVGVAGEAGELLDAAKKHWAYGKELDVSNVIEELGDLEFYMCALRSVLGISRHQTLQANADKLTVRYASGKYSDTAAIERADKQLPELASLRETSAELLARTFPQTTEPPPVVDLVGAQTTWLFPNGQRES